MSDRTVSVIFFGTAEFACPSLQTLVNRTEFQVMGVVTQPDKPGGRKLRLLPPPVKSLASRLGLPIWQPARCRDPEFLEAVRTLAPALGVVAAYGQILPPSLLDLPTHGFVNVHASLLPRWRGAAPIQRAILAGDAETGVTIMQVDAGLDSGPILSQDRTRITEGDTAQSLHDRLAQSGAELLARTIPDYIAGRMTPHPQPVEGVTYADKITKGEGCIDWSRPAPEVWNRVRAFTPWPGAFTFVSRPGTPSQTVAAGGGRERIKIWGAEPVASDSGTPGTVLAAGADSLVVGCGSDALRLRELQREGGKRLAADAFLAGFPLPPGTVLG